MTLRAAYGPLAFYSIIKGVFMADYPRSFEIVITAATVQPAGTQITVPVAPGQTPVYDGVNNVVTFILGQAADPTEGTGT
jgi:hypothetical protein